MREHSNEPTDRQRGIALLMMDFQNTIVEMVPESRRERVLSHAQVLLGKARAASVPVFHVVVRFRAGHPEVHPANKGFSAIKAAGRLLEGTPGAEIHASVSPVAGEPVVTKRRVGAFGTTDLRTMLGARGIHTLVLAGLVTGGVVTTTVREAADLDFTLYVVVCVRRPGRGGASRPHGEGLREAGDGGEHGRDRSCVCSRCFRRASAGSVNQ